MLNSTTRERNLIPSRFKQPRKRVSRIANCAAAFWLQAAWRHRPAPSPRHGTGWRAPRQQPTAYELLQELCARTPLAKAMEVCPKGYSVRGEALRDMRHGVAKDRSLHHEEGGGPRSLLLLPLGAERGGLGLDRGAT